MNNAQKKYFMKMLENVLKLTSFEFYDEEEFSVFNNYGIPKTGKYSMVDVLFIFLIGDWS